MASQQKVDRESVLAALDRVTDPDRGRSVVALGMVEGVAVRAGEVSFALSVALERAPHLEALRHAAEQAVRAVPGVTSVTAVLTAQRPQGGSKEAGRAAPLALDGVSTILAVASGKGGVGKSTVAVNLALALKQTGLRIGLLDADIYGPSVPRMMGIDGKPDSVGDKIRPMKAHGVVCMSIGFLIEEDRPVIWRGPMVMGALEQMLRNVDWGRLDVLVVDLPPGTGDAQLTMAQRVPLAGVVIVSTPQDVALLDARKGLNMFRKVNVPIFGLIENMSYHICEQCGHRAEIFGHGGARAEASRLAVDFLGELPLTQDIRESGDAGRPIVVSKPESPQAGVYRAIAERVRAKLAPALAGADS